MHDTILSSGWDTVLFAIPFLGLLLAALFRLDGCFATPKRVAGRCRPRAGSTWTGGRSCAIRTAGPGARRA